MWDNTLMHARSTSGFTFGHIHRSEHGTFIATENTTLFTAKFLYECIWCRYGCPIELVSDQGSHFINEIVKGLIQHYAVLHK